MVTLHMLNDLVKKSAQLNTDRLLVGNRVSVLRMKDGCVLGSPATSQREREVVIHHRIALGGQCPGIGIFAGYPYSAGTLAVK
jgi:hypothetical protein